MSARFLRPLGLALGLLGSSRAWAAPVRTLAIDAEGRGAAAIAASLEAGGDWTKIEVSNDVASAAPARDFATPTARRAMLGRLRHVATDKRADAALVVFIAHTRLSRRVSLVMIDPSSASEAPLVDVQVSLPVAPSPGDAAKLEEALRPGFAKLPLPPAPPPPVPPALPVSTGGVTSDVTDADNAVAHPRREWDRSVVTIAAAFQLQSRSMSYNDAIGSPKTYDLPTSPAVAADVELFPAGRSNVPVLRDLGLAGDFALAVGLSSVPAAGGAAIDTHWTRWNAGLRGRARVGRSRTWFVLGVTAGAGQESFAFSGGGGGDLPSVSYTYLRAMVDLSVPIGPVVLVAGGGFLPVLSGGDVLNRFRGSSVNAIEASLGVRVPFARYFEGRLSANYTRYFYSFDPQPGDAFVAGGALDEMLRFQAALAVGY